ncbi:hypothetical protein IscW_ISCW015014 [Ixodes scapularis]|uniref:Uncharacterized protein n=1 Tax=Ixodes scapularis TaxID=6945 RepID=B7QHS2_IXOSC|nr:hypothetical protein IscW_ISCW015014 [Ixodes scapularis]|eukprot:XP_002414729.1 hypothetical protein IscW_ISCW015014 [Ixodes scapularis]
MLIPLLSPIKPIVQSFPCFSSFPRILDGKGISTNCWGVEDGLFWFSVFRRFLTAAGGILGCESTSDSSTSFLLS